jgi:hypothetical protein
MRSPPHDGYEAPRRSAFRKSMKARSGVGTWRRLG